MNRNYNESAAQLSTWTDTMSRGGSRLDETKDEIEEDEYGDDFENYDEDFEDDDEPAPSKNSHKSSYNDAKNSSIDMDALRQSMEQENAAALQQQRYIYFYLFMRR